jgi:hypothetical protein
LTGRFCPQVAAALKHSRGVPPAAQAAPHLNHTTKERYMRQDTKKPANLRADVMPTDGYLLSVDGKLKKRYETVEEAVTEGSKLKQSFPMIQVAIYDAAKHVSTPVELQKTEVNE